MKELSKPSTAKCTRSLRRKFGDPPPPCQGAERLPTLAAKGMVGVGGESLFITGAVHTTGLVEYQYLSWEVMGTSDPENLRLYDKREGNTKHAYFRKMVSKRIGFWLTTSIEYLDSYLSP